MLNEIECIVVSDLFLCQLQFFVFCFPESLPVLTCPDSLYIINYNWGGSVSSVGSGSACVESVLQCSLTRGRTILEVLIWLLVMGLHYTPKFSYGKSPDT